MTLKGRNFLAMAVLCALAQPLSAADGVLIAEKTTTGGATQSTEMQIERQRMRVESIAASGEKQVFMFDGPKQTLWIIDFGKKTYNEVTKADVDRMAGQMADAMAKMQEQMQNLPPAQRAQMEAVMQGRGMMAGLAAALPKTEYRKTGTDKVGQWTCDKYEGFQKEQKVSELCTVDPKAFGLTPADFEVSRQLQEFFQKLMPQNAENLFRLGAPEQQGFSGVPVRRTSFGQRQSVTEVTSVSRGPIADDLFVVPAGFQKQAMLGGRGGR